MSDKLEVLYVHNILSSEYKLELFNRLNVKLKESDIDFFVLQMARSEYIRKSLNKKIKTNITHNYHLIHDGYYEELSLAKRLKSISRVIFNRRPNVVIFPGYFDVVFFLVSSYLFFFTDVKVIIGIDNNDYSEGGGFKDSFKRVIKKIICFPYHGAMTYSNSPSKTLTNMLNKKCKLLTGVSCVNELFLPDNDIFDVNENVITFVGRFSEEKGIDRITTLIDYMIMKDVKFTFNFIGNGELFLSLKNRYLNNLNVVFFGAIPIDEVYKVISSSSCLILPSYSEPWGLVVSESLLCGTPVIVSAEVGAKEIIFNDINGYVHDFEFDDNESLVYKINKTKGFNRRNVKELAKEEKTEFVSKKIKDYLQRFLIS